MKEKSDDATGGPAGSPLAEVAPVAPDGAAVPASPYKSAAEDLEVLRKTFRSACQHFARRIDIQIVGLRDRIVDEGERKMSSEVSRPKPKGAKGRDGDANSRLPDLRDIITLLRTLEVKPTAGRRKDLKKIESLVDELQLLIERWK